jgi:hypothetical protein
MVLETTNQWKVVSGELTSPMRKGDNSPMQVELEAEVAWDLYKVWAYSEIMLHVEDEA